MTQPPRSTISPIVDPSRGTLRPVSPSTMSTSAMPRVRTPCLALSRARSDAVSLFHSPFHAQLTTSLAVSVSPYPWLTSNPMDSVRCSTAAGGGAPAVRMRTLALLDTALEDIAWLIRVSSLQDNDGDGNLRGLPNIAQNEPVLGMVWDNIARLHTGGLAARDDAAATLASLAVGNSYFAKYIVEEDDVAVLVKLIKEGTDDGQEAAAMALGLLCRDEDSLHMLLHSGACSVFAAALKEPLMRVQAAVADAIASLARHIHKCQDLFAQSNDVRHLVTHLASTPSIPPPCPHLAAHRLSSRPLRFLRRYLCVRPLGRPEIRRDPRELPCCSPCAVASPSPTSRLYACLSCATVFCPSHAATHTSASAGLAAFAERFAAVGCSCLAERSRRAVGGGGVTAGSGGWL
jgi:hypothetical protein